MLRIVNVFENNEYTQYFTNTIPGATIPFFREGGENIRIDAINGWNRRKLLMRFHE